MAGVYKKEHSRWRSMSVVDRRTLEEFPEDEKKQYTLEPELAEPVPEEEIDPEAIRAAVFEEAREEAERIVQEAYAEGYRRGEAAGLEAFEARVADSIDIFHNAAQAIREAHQQFLTELEPEVLALCASIADRIIQRELRTDDTLVRDIVMRALTKMTDRRKLTIKVNSDDLENIREFAAVITQSFAECVDLKVEADPAISRGGCLIDSPADQADARIETMFNELLTELEA